MSETHFRTMAVQTRNATLLRILEALIRAGLDSPVWLPPIIAALSNGANISSVIVAIEAGLPELEKILKGNDALPS